MDLRNLPAALASPDPIRMAVTRATSDFVDVDLSTPKSTNVALVPPSTAFASPVPSLTSLNPGREHLYPPNPAVLHGSSGIPDITVTSQCHPPVDVQGHTGDTDGGKCLPPPSGQSSASASCPSHTDPRALLITEAAAKQAFEEYGKSKCCYGGAPTKDMTTEELQPLNTYRYTLETFTESRVCEWVTEQYTGQHVDCTNAASTMQPWDVPVAVPDMFKDGTQKMKVPYTSCVKACSHCKGMGKNMCRKCHGSGRIQCMWCNGTGRRMQMEMCHQCYGSGTESCRMCNNITAQNCAPCGGKGQVLTYMQLTINWTVHGERIYTDEQLSVSPLVNFPDSSVTWASQNALEQHCTQFSLTCRVLRQRQIVELLPLTRVRYTWKGNHLNYFVYGTENKVYVQNDPQKCCCAVM